MRDYQILLLCLLGFSIGCGGSGVPLDKSVPVSGVVTYQGQPLPNYRVTFIPADGRQSGSGVSDADGKFVLSTHEAGDGVPPGLCKVIVAWEGPAAADGGGAETPVENPRDLPKPPVNLPPKYADSEQSGITQEVPEDGLTDVKINLE